MIRLSKVNTPRILENNKIEWTQRVMEELAKGKKISEIKLKYNHKEVKQQLNKETNGKCAYCESKISQVSYPNIEHILPKKHFPELTYEWSNLTFVCSVCNINKENYYDSTLPLIDPYNDNIKEQFFFWGPSYQQLSEIGEFTIYKLDLNRTPLIEKRTEKINKMTDLFAKYKQARIPQIQEMYRKQILKMTNEDEEYSALCKDFLSSIEKLLQGYSLTS